MKVYASEARIMKPTRVVKANLEGIFRLIKFVCHTSVIYTTEQKGLKGSKMTPWKKCGNREVSP